FHEVIGYANTVVGVLEEDRRVSFAVHAATITILEKDPRLLLFVGLAVDEFHNVRMACVQDDHLGCAPRLAARLDHACERVESAHKGNRTGRGATSGESFARGT